MKNTTIRGFLLGGMLALAGQAYAPLARAQQADYETGMVPSPHMFLPGGKNLEGMVFLISGAQGWGAADEAQAKALVAQNAAVVGIDFPSYLRSLSTDDGDCIYMVSDIEDISQQVQRRIGNSTYRHPIVAGIGDAGALVLGMIAQSPNATIAEGIAVDPSAGIPLKMELCTPATKDVSGDRTIYGLTDGPLPAAVNVALTSAADDAGRQHVQALKTEHDDIDIQQVAVPAADALSNLLKAAIARTSQGGQNADLPLTILDAKPALDTMAIIYSGDGGWRDLDSEVGGYLQTQGVPTVGIDSLRYFWSEKKPAETARDLAGIIDTYRRKWGVSHVMLIGYSFGADIIPATYNLLPAPEKARVTQMSLLAISKEVDFVISVTGWLGVASSGKDGNTIEDIAKIDPKIVQCVYGTDEDDDPCPTLKDKGVEVVPIDGGHHFDEDYEALGKRLIDSLRTRLK